MLVKVTKRLLTREGNSLMYKILGDGIERAYQENDKEYLKWSVPEFLNGLKDNREINRAWHELGEKKDFDYSKDIEKIAKLIEKHGGNNAN